MIPFANLYYDLNVDFQLIKTFLVGPNIIDINSNFHYKMVTDHQFSVLHPRICFDARNCLFNQWI